MLNFVRTFFKKEKIYNSTNYLFYRFPKNVSMFENYFAQKSNCISNKPIRFLGNDFLMTPEKLYIQMGVPDYKYKRKFGVDVYKIYFYMQIIEDKKCVPNYTF